ncbi:nucleoside hydrolase [Desulfoplanes sp.]
MTKKTFQWFFTKIFVLVCAGCLLVCTTCSAVNDSVVESKQKSTRVIIDTDVDSDDAMAILYLMNVPNVEVIGVTVTGTGFMNQIQGVPVALKLVRLGGMPTIPVSYGADRAIVPFGGFPAAWQQSALDFYASAGLPDITVPPNPLPSAQLLIDLVRNLPEKVTILALGPMTNIALALQKDPSIADNIERIVMSAGAFAPHPGNFVDLTPQTVIEKTGSYRSQTKMMEKMKSAEYNVILDAAAFSVILQSGIPVLISPLNASDQAKVTDTVLDPLKNVDKPVAKFIVKVIQPLLDQKVSTYFWDPVAASIVANPSICTNLQKKNIAVEIDNDKTYGTTMENPYGNEVDVCFDIDAKNFYKSFIETIKTAPYSNAAKPQF